VTRRALLLFRAAIVGAAVNCGSALAGPAWAGVTVTPDQAVRGDAAKVTFRVTDDRSGAYTTRVELRLPASTPIAEVYPMSVPDWAPQTSNRTLDRPVDGLHHGTTDEVTATVTWTRVGAGRPGGSIDLSVSMGPMPDADRLVFSLVQTYSDGTVVTWGEQGAAGGPAPKNPAPVVTLVAPGSGSEHAAQHGGASAAAGVDEAAPVPESGSGLGGAELMGMGLAGGVAVGLGLGAVAIAVTRRRTAAAVGPDVSDSAPGESTDRTGTPIGGADQTESVRSTGTRESDSDGDSPATPRRAWQLRN
jgi:uncharacterized protein YcnI